jgi:hypothetical protein
MVYMLAILYSVKGLRQTSPEGGLYQVNRPDLISKRARQGSVVWLRLAVLKTYYSYPPDRSRRVRATSRRGTDRRRQSRSAMATTMRLGHGDASVSPRPPWFFQVTCRTIFLPLLPPSWLWFLIYVLRFDSILVRRGRGSAMTASCARSASIVASPVYI